MFFGLTFHCNVYAHSLAYYTGGVDCLAQSPSPGLTLENPLIVDDEIEAGRKTVEGRRWGPTKNYPKDYLLTFVRKTGHRALKVVVIETRYWADKRSFVEAELEWTAPHILQRSATRQEAVEATIAAYDAIFVARQGWQWDHCGMAAINFKKI